MTVTIHRLDGSRQSVEAMKWFKFNEQGLITLWYETYDPAQS
ncbi:hypothetical protein [Dongshaea marina]|nr:hypothetical protein [Dongshaea marina]